MITEQCLRIVSDHVRDRLHELGWDDRKKTAVDMLGVNEHLAGALIGTQALRGEPSDAKLAEISERLGWARDGLARLMAGDPTGADVIHSHPLAAYAKSPTPGPDPGLAWRVAQLEKVVPELLEAAEQLQHQIAELQRQLQA